MSNTSNKKRWRRVKCAAVFLCGFGGVTSGGLRAETVAWYHFDEGEIGAAPAATGFANAMAPADNPNFLAATVTRGEPTYGKGFGDNVTWFDPVACSWALNGTALDFKNARIQIPNDARLHLKSATIELFFKYTDKRPGFFRVLEKSNAWLIFFLDGNKLNARVFSSADGGTTGSNNNQFTATVSGPSVGQWHHLALVIDDTAKKAHLYFDYQCVGSTTYAGELASATANSALFLGNNNDEATKAENPASMNGLIDELRISDVVLTPDQFLRPSIGATAANVHPETVVYLPFETGDVSDIACFGVTDMTAWRKSTPLLNHVWTNSLVSPVNSVSIEYGSDDATCATLDTAVRTPTVRRDVLSATDVPNAQVLKTELRNSAPETQPDRSPWIKVDDFQTDADGNRSHGMLTDSFTIEFFGNFAKPTGTADCQLLYCGTKTAFNASITALENANAVRLNVTGALGNYPTVSCDTWHHFAFRYDKTRRQVALFLDYRPCGSPVEFDFDSELAYLNAPFELFNRDGDGGNGAHGLVDDVRITKRALEPQEFLTGHGVASGTAAAWIDFEDDLLVKPYPDVTLEGTASAMDGGEAPTRATRKPCRRIILPDDTKRDNRWALALAGGQVAYGRNLMIENLANQTVEFFLCGDSAPSGAGVLRLAAGADATVWAVTAGANGQLSVTVGETSHTFDVPLADAKWRHYALTFAASGADATTVTLWVDGEQVGEPFTAGTLTRTFTDSALTVGGGAAAFVGGIDEIRITPQVLAPTDFLRASRPGVMLIVR